jgi:peptide/nickel transport system permease protein
MPGETMSADATVRTETPPPGMSDTELAADDGTLAVGPALDERLSVASQRQLIWWRFRKHKLALVSAFIIGLFYLVAIGGDFFAYTPPNDATGARALISPQPIEWFSHGGFNPHVHPMITSRNPNTFQIEYRPDKSRDVPVRLFVKGYDYKLFGLFKTNIHLFGTVGTPDDQALYVLGTDDTGQDVFSRLVLATRTSMFIGLTGVFLSVIFGVVLGGLSGYYGGILDTIIQRVIEIIRSLPTIPLWMGLAAAVPKTWSITKTYFAITLIISLIGWTELARVVRGRFLQVRSEDFILAAELAGSRPRRIIFKHIMPLFTSHIIAATTLALPLMIVAETSLSFLGLGLRPPAVSWGVMLQDAQNIQTLALSPWLLVPVVPVVVAILAFNFLGDGLRDAADPYDS